MIVAIVLMLFLMNVRTTIITLTAIPVSLAVGLLTMDFMGMGLNVMALGGLSVAIGVLVDDAIIDVENVYRRLRQNQELAEQDRRSALDVIFDASNEIRPAMVFATIIIVMVFVPLLFLQGLRADSSATRVDPHGLDTRLPSGRPHADARLVQDPPQRQRIQPISARIMAGRGLANHRPTLEWALGFRAGTGCRGDGDAGDNRARDHVRYLVFPRSTKAPSRSSSCPPGTSLEESDRIGARVERQLALIDGVETVARRTGRAERDEHAEPVSNSRSR